MKSAAAWSLLLALVSPALSFAQAQPEANKEATVAEINGKKISLAEFERRYNENIKFFKFTPPTKVNILNEVVKFELGVAEALRLGLDKDPDVRERMNTILYQSLVDKVLTSEFEKIKVEEKDVRQYCKQYPEVRTSHVYVPLRVSPLKAEEATARKKINDALAELNQGKSFEQVVAKFSDGYATSAGGDIGFQMKDKLDPTYYAQAQKLKVGEYTKSVVRSQFGLHIIKLTGIRSCNDINVAEWQRMIFDEKRMKLFSDYLDKLRDKAKVTLNLDLVKE